MKLGNLKKNMFLLTGEPVALVKGRYRHTGDEVQL
jgi:hypothetical protein